MLSLIAISVHSTVSRVHKTAPVRLHRTCATDRHYSTEITVLSLYGTPREPSRGCRQVRLWGLHAAAPDCTCITKGQLRSSREEALAVVAYLVTTRLDRVDVQPQRQQVERQRRPDADVLLAKRQEWTLAEMHLRPGRRRSMPG